MKKTFAKHTPKLLNRRPYLIGLSLLGKIETDEQIHVLATGENGMT